METTTTENSQRDILQYESQIWAVADLMRGAGIKDSKFPDFMMPFFALVMLESRMLNVIKKLQKDGFDREADFENFKGQFLDEDCGYNEYIVEQGKTLSDICSNDKTFEQDFENYRRGFDEKLKELLGIDRGTEQKKYLNMDGIVAELRAKKILMQTMTIWAGIDLSGFDNSAITTLEEHIKRRWADISAETAGEQYTPDDIISLIAEIVAAKIQVPVCNYVHLYDPTCGGANLLFGVADRLVSNAGYKRIATYGSEINDALYALSAIESRFRGKSTIHCGNTLTDYPFRNRPFDVIVANPPYGVNWKGYEKEIRADQTGQFNYYPSVSDGQLLFMQHILAQLGENGIAVEVHNGSTLFSGDAGSGESNIRKYIFDQDWVEAIIQMPSDEFFNTGIYTYLWIMNKNKPAERRNKVMLINGSNGWQLLKKSKGSKRREMNAEHRQKIVDALVNFQDCEIGKVFPKWHFYYNKQNITLTDVNADGEWVAHTICNDSKPHKLTLQEIRIGEQNLTKFVGVKAECGKETFDTLKAYDYKEEPMTIICTDGKSYTFDAKRNTILETTSDGTVRDLGCGKFTFKLSNSAKTQLSTIQCNIEPAFSSDYEIVPCQPNPDTHGRIENEAAIDAFLKRYIFKPYYKRDNVIGVELNFNKEFYVPEEIGSVEDILAEIRELDKELKEIEI
ncbi:MAG: N-6 DNA methylase [Bacteroidales bacterium]|nr:N-6 DNA methylase [Candidatus Liminaster caballi]